MCGAHAYHVAPPVVQDPSWCCTDLPRRSHKLVLKSVLCVRTSHKSTGIRGTLLGIVGAILSTIFGMPSWGGLGPQQCTSVWPVDGSYIREKRLTLDRISHTMWLIPDCLAILGHARDLAQSCIGEARGENQG
jgi:hypothetical protein